MTARVLILYIMQDSGHHAAARYLEAALQTQMPGAQTRCIDLLKHTHPKWERIVQRMYMGTVRRTPELWEALYDNVWVEYLLHRLRELVQRGRSESLRRLMAEFAPHAVVCTQAYPFAVLASFAARHAPDLPLFAVTTDFVPHRFWITGNAHGAGYVVPTESAAARLMWLGIEQEQIHVLGIPVSAAHMTPAPPPSDARRGRRVLVMGGGRGLGVRYRTARKLDRCPADFTIDVVCGTNRRLRQRLARNRHRFKHPIRLRGYVRNAVALMRRADLLITKAGGMTLAEAACVGVPLLLVHPLPGQERGNTEVMVHHGAALHLTSEHDIPRSVTMLLENRALLAMMRDKALALGRPDAAADIARLVLDAIPPDESP
jgi:processive 1,2-diacylglycerol beta-glucosyltransferase